MYIAENWLLFIYLMAEYTGKPFFQLPFYSTDKTSNFLLCFSGAGFEYWARVLEVSRRMKKMFHTNFKMNCQSEQACYMDRTRKWSTALVTPSYYVAAQFQMSPVWTPLSCRRSAAWLITSRKHTVLPWLIRWQSTRKQQLRGLGHSTLAH